MKVQHFIDNYNDSFFHHFANNFLFRKLTKLYNFLKIRFKYTVNISSFCKYMKLNKNKQKKIIENNIKPLLAINILVFAIIKETTKQKKKKYQNTTSTIHQLDRK